MSKPKVSIGLPVFNGEQFIRQTLDSFLVQSFEDFELIISDNASSDGTEILCQEYALKDPRIKYHRQTTNKGAAWNFNHVFQLASGDYYMWACHDDIFKQSYLQVCVDFLDKNPDCVLAGTSTRLQNPDSQETIDTDRGVTTGKRTAFERYKLLKKEMYGGHFAGGVFYGLYRRGVLQELLPFYNMIAADHLHLLRTVLKGSIYTYPEPLMIKRRGGISRSFKNIARINNINNPFHRYCPILMLECYVQKYIFSSAEISLIERLRISFFSLSYYFYVYARFLYWCLQGKASLFE